MGVLPLNAAPRYMAANVFFRSLNVRVDSWRNDAISYTEISATKIWGTKWLKLQKRVLYSPCGHVHEFS